MNIRPHVLAICTAAVFLAAAQMATGVEKAESSSGRVSGGRHIKPAGKNFWPTPSSKPPAYWVKHPGFLYSCLETDTDPDDMADIDAAWTEVRAAQGDSRQYFLRKIEESELTFGRDAPETLKWAGAMAYYSNPSNEWEFAHSLYRRIYQSRSKTLGSEHPLTLISLDRLAYHAAFGRREDENLQLTRRAYIGSEHTLGPTHPLTIQRLTKLVFRLNYRNEDIEFEKLCRRLVAIRRMAFPSETPCNYAACFLLADACVRNGKLREAETYFRQILVFVENRLGPCSIETTDAMSNLAVALALKGEYSEAEALLLQAYDRFNAAIDLIYPEYVVYKPISGNAATNLAIMYFHRKEYDKALPFAEAGAGPFEQSFGFYSKEMKRYAGFVAYLRQRK